VKEEKVNWKNKIYLYLVKKEKINWKKKDSIFTLWKKRKLIGEITLSLPCQQRERERERERESHFKLMICSWKFVRGGRKFLTHSFMTNFLQRLKEKLIQAGGPSWVSSSCAHTQKTLLSALSWCLKISIPPPVASCFLSQGNVRKNTTIGNST